MGNNFRRGDAYKKYCAKSVQVAKQNVKEWWNIECFISYYLAPGINVNLR